MRFVTTGILLLLVGITAPIYAQRQKDGDKQKQRDQDRQQHESAQRRQQMNGPSQQWQRVHQGNDDVYIDYSGDGYYLYNRRYPWDRVSVSVYVD